MCFLTNAQALLHMTVWALEKGSRKTVFPATGEIPALASWITEILFRYHGHKIELPIMACVQTMTAAIRKSVVVGLPSSRSYPNTSSAILSISERGTAPSRRIAMIMCT